MNNNIVNASSHKINSWLANPKQFSNLAHQVHKAITIRKIIVIAETPINSNFEISKNLAICY